MPARPHPIREFASGFATLGRGFGFWRERPGLMWLGLLPAAIVAALIVAAVAVLSVFLDPLTLALTSFAEGWEPGWRDLLRILLGVALVIATLFLAARTFTAVTLLVGAPFYDRIQTAADESRGAIAEGAPLGFWASLGATLVLVLQSILASIVVLLLGVIPAVGAALAAVIGFVLTSYGLSRELTFAPLARRGLDGGARSRARGRRRARALGFGVAVQLCYLVPLGAVIAMPAAVAGSAFLARDLLEPGPGGEPSDPVSASAG
jgi:CysZ protein